MSAHTPGPWFYDGMAGLPLPLAKNDHGEPLLMVRGRGASVAEIIPQQNAAEANARLVAAAPNLLTQLRFAVMRLARVDGETASSSVRPWTQCLLPLARCSTSRQPSPSNASTYLVDQLNLILHKHHPDALPAVIS